MSAAGYGRAARLSSLRAVPGYSWVMDTTLAGLGVVIVITVIGEVFRDLFRPGDSSVLNDLIGRAWFNVLRRWPRLLPLAGPLAVVTVIGTWVTLLIFGFGFLYYGHYPDAFRTSVGGRPPADGRFLTALYFS